MLIKDAPVVWNTLRGLICVYKPAEVKAQRIREKLIHKICTELNEMECRAPEEYVSITGEPSSKLQVRVQPNLADHPLVVGPRYQNQDVFLSWSNYLGFNTSGVLLFGVRSGTSTAKYIRENRPTRVYRIKGKLGFATENGFKDGKVVEKSTWRHVKQFHIDKMLAAMQASHQKKMFDLCGVDLQSELAFKLACDGPIRPANSKIPVIYGIKCVEFDSPDFTLEIHCVNEYEKYLINLIHEIGMRLHSTAHCVALQCIRHSYFTLEEALLPKHFNLENILANLGKTNAILNENEHLVKQKSASLV